MYLRTMASGIVVHKFGGAALADAAAIGVVAALLAGEEGAGKRVVVTSALRDVTNASARGRSVQRVSVADAIPVIGTLMTAAEP